MSLVLFLSTLQPIKLTFEKLINSKLLLLRHHKPMSIVPFKYLRIPFTTLKWDYLRQYWNLAHNHTLYIISGLLGVKYSKKSIIPLYIVGSIDLPFSSLSSLMDELIGVFIVLDSSMLNLLRRSLMYFASLMNVPSSNYLIWSPKKKLSSLFMLI